MNLFPKGKNANKIWQATIITVLGAIFLHLLIVVVFAIVNIQMQPAMDPMGLAASDATYICSHPAYDFYYCTFGEMIKNVSGVALILSFFTLLFSVPPTIILILVLPKIYDDLLHKKQRSKLATWSIYLAVFFIATLMIAYPWILGARI